MLDTINNAATTGGIGVTASLNSAGTGIQITDNSGGTGNLVVGDADAEQTATALGIAGTFDATVPPSTARNLQRQWVNENTSCRNYNGGKGVAPRHVHDHQRRRQHRHRRPEPGNFNTIGDVIAAINATKIGVTASINANGNGLLLTDTAGGTGQADRQGVNGTTATDLNIAGTATDPTGKTIDGSFEKTIAVNAADTLADRPEQDPAARLRRRRQHHQRRVGRLALPPVADRDRTPGRAGRFVFDAGTTSLQTHDLVKAQDAAVFFGGGGACQPLLVTSSTNQLTNVIPGVTVEPGRRQRHAGDAERRPRPDRIAHAVQTISSRDSTRVVDDDHQAQLSFDTTTNTAGLLLGDPTTQSVQEQMYRSSTPSSKAPAGTGRWRTWASPSPTAASLKFDQNNFKAAYATDPTAVGNLFTQAKTGLGTVLTNSMNRAGGPGERRHPDREQDVGLRDAAVPGARSTS